MSAARRIASGTLLAAGALLLAAGAAELALRAAGWPSGGDVRVVRLPGATADAEPFTGPDELLLYAPLPFARTYSWCAMDAHGWRTPTFDERKPPGTLRVVTTGDSTTFGLSVLDDENWSSRLRAALAGLCAGAATVEVVNAGVTGYSTLQNRLQVERDVLPVQPDLLVWLVSGVNDTTRVEGPGDAEQSQRNRSLSTRLARLHLARLFGWGRPWIGVSTNAEDASPTGRPRVSLDEFEANLDAVARALPGQLVLGLFPPLPVFRATPAIAALSERASAWAAARGVPVVDMRPVLDALAAVPLYLDNVHPDPAGHVLIARAALAAAVPRLPLPAERAAWIEAWLRALQGDIAGQAAALQGPGAPARFAELVALDRDGPALDERLRRLDPELPASVREWDPLLGRRCCERSLARVLLEAPDDTDRREQIERFVLPRDPLLACFADDAAFLAASDELRALARAAVTFSADIGLPPLRADVRRLQARSTSDPAAAVELLAAACALAPSDDEARCELAFALRRAGRGDEARVEWTRLAAGSGPLADFATGLMAFEDERWDEAERKLRQAVEGRPSLGWARVLLSRIYLKQDRLDESLKELALGAGLIGSSDFPALMEQINARRRELAGGAAPAADGARH